MILYISSHFVRNCKRHIASNFVMAGVGELLAVTVVKQLFGKLSSAIWEKVVTQLNLTEELESLITKLDNIQEVLKKKQSMEGGDASSLMNKLKAAAYDMEDMLMDIECEKSRKNNYHQGNTAKVSIPMKFRIILPKRMKDIKDKIEEITKLPGFINNLNTIPNEPYGIQTNKTFSSIGEDIVGRTKEKMKLIKLLKEDCKHPIIPIYGLGGLGKTTLAQMVFNDSETQEDFDIRLWVHVSTKFDVEKIGRSIISQVDGQSNQYDLASVQQRVEIILSDNRSLIVLDDIWEEDMRNLADLRTILGVGKLGRKIIVTTRTEQIAKLMNEKLQFRLDGLPEKECFDLFKAIAFPSERTVKDQNKKEMLGEKIVKKCDGVPLAIKSLGFRLQNEDLIKWEEAAENDLWKQEKKQTSATKRTAILPSLKVSYYYMPEYLRPCFAYFSALPKGFRVEKNELIHRWIALGFVATDHNPDDYLNELVGMSFLQTASCLPSISARYLNPRNTSYQMHDLVHELATSIAIDEVAFSYPNRGESSCLNRDSHRYILFSGLSSWAPEIIGMPSKARAIHFIHCTGLKPPKNAFSKTKWLRVLDLSGMGIVELPESMGTLHHLQVLNLSENSYLHNIPSSICSEFQKLRYLDLHGCSDLEELPDSIGEIKALLHLDLSGCKKLQRLPFSFGHLQNLESLNISCCSGLRTVPDNFSELINLEQLNMSHCNFTELPASLFRDMKNLLLLNFSGCRSLKELPGLCGSKYGCLQLEILDLSDCNNLTKLPVSSRELSTLRYLNLSGCSRLEIEIAMLDKFTGLEYLNLTEVFLGRNISGVGGRGDIEAPSTSTGETSDGSSEVSELYRKLKAMAWLEYLTVGGLTLFSDNGIAGMDELLTLPDFCVREKEDRCSNISLLRNIIESTHSDINIRFLERVKCPEEAHAAELRSKQNLQSLSLEWSLSDYVTDNENNQNDIDVLQNLLPPRSLKHLTIKGYKHSVFPVWIREINDTLPNLVKIVLSNFRGDRLPPLRHLSNLEEIEIRYIFNIHEVCIGPCKKLRRLSLINVEGEVIVRFDDNSRGKKVQIEEHEFGDAQCEQGDLEADRYLPEKKEIKPKGFLKMASNLKGLLRGTSAQRREGAIFMSKENQLLPAKSNDPCEKAKAPLTTLDCLKTENCQCLKFHPSAPRSKEIVMINTYDIDSFYCVHPETVQRLKIKCMSFDATSLRVFRSLEVLEVDFETFPRSSFEMTKSEKLVLPSWPLQSGRYSDDLVHIDIHNIPFVKANEVVRLSVKLTDEQQGDSSNIKLLYEYEDRKVDKMIIKNLENVKEPEEVVQGMLASHYYQLHSLCLMWSDSCANEIKQGGHPIILMDKAVLEKLQPPPSLLTLQIEGYRESALCPWLMNLSSFLTNIVTVELANMPMCKHLPPLGGLEHLEVLHISCMHAIKTVDTSFYRRGRGHIFRKLRELTLRTMASLESWSLIVAEDEEHLMVDGDESFQELGKVIIKDCPMLNIYSGFARAVRCMAKSAARSRSKLLISYQELNEKSSSGLRSVEIENCGLLTNGLEILGCPEETGLENLTIRHCSNLLTLPESIRRCRSLVDMEILECWNFDGLPDWIKELTSLTSLKIHSANLEKLPQSIRSLTSLKTLVLAKCNYKLREWCNTEEGRDIFQSPDTREKPDFDISSKAVLDFPKITSSQLIEVNIRKLELIKPEEAASLQLAARERLRFLHLEWSSTERLSGAEYKAILEILKPHHNLEKLHLKNYAGEGFPCWIYSLSNLVKLELEGRLGNVPSLNQLQNLEELFIRYARGVDLNIWSTPPHNKLKRIILHSVEHVVVQTSSSVEQQTNHEDSFPSLQILKIKKCQYLSFQPAILRSERYIISGSVLKEGLFRSSSTGRVMNLSSSAKSSKLQMIGGNCELPVWESFWHSNITELTIDGIESPTTLPARIQGWDSLQKLEILNCRHIRFLPEQFGELTCLRELKLDTNGLTALPTCIQQLTKLHTLTLSNCTKELTERCCQSGEDWTKIAHIQKVQTEPRK